MSVEFGMANQYIRDLSANVTRGLRQKARLGIFQALAPLGYLNDPRTRTIIVDRRKAPRIREAFQLYAKNQSRLEDVANFLYKHGIKTGGTRGWTKGGGKPLKRDQISFLPRIRSTTAISNTVVKCTKENISQLSRRNYLIVCKKYYNFEATNGTNSKITHRHIVDFSNVASAAVQSQQRKNSNFKERKRAPIHLLPLHEKRGACAGEYVREEVLDSNLSHLLEIRPAQRMGE